MDVKDILARCDHTLLRVDAGEDEIRAICDQAVKYSCASVCIPPCHVKGASGYLAGRVPVCTVIGFPNGYMTTAAKAFEAADAVKNGADEIDMVVNLAMVKDAAWSSVSEDIRAVRAACEGKVLKVIIECCLLTDDEKRMLCRIVSDSGADFIKTSTGFSTGGATREDVALLRACCDSKIKVKAAGGISSLEDAEDFIKLGADRLGTSRIVKLAMELEKAEGAPEEDY